MKDVGPCSRCGCTTWVPDALHDAARRSENITFYCAYGHPMHFPQGESATEKLRRERDRLAQTVAERNDEVNRQRKLREAAERSLTATKGHVTRIKNRVGAGVCPCCTRSFGNLAAHMKTQHPSFRAEAAE